MLNNVCKTDNILLPMKMGINEINNFYLIENTECVES
jgi:hypothetical protein